MVIIQMSKKRYVVFSLLILLSYSHNLSANYDDPITPSYPSIPGSYEVLTPGKLVKRSQVNFASYLVRYTNGYKVTTPEGNELIVDNIAQPKCAFYASYVTTDDDGFLSLGSSTKVVSNVYIGEVNFDNCK